MKGAGAAFLGRLGAFVDIIAVIIFANLYGSATFGLFSVLFGYVQLVSIVSDFGMTSALQRFVPSQSNEQGVILVLRNALGVSFLCSLFFALLLYLLAPSLASFINADALDSETLSRLIRFYAWAVPLWTSLDVTTAAIRARQVFGPEIKVRVFYEQGLRLVAGIVFFLVGWRVYGLFAAHLVSLAISVLLAAQLLGRHYNLFKLLSRRGGEGQGLLGEMLRFSSLMVLPNASKKLLSNLPVFFLNGFLPGAAGAQAAGYYTVARKIVSALQVIRESFEYVLAPMASARRDAAAADRLGDIYAFSIRFIFASFLPGAVILVSFGPEFLGLSGPEFLVGSTALMVLAAGRWFEAATGPSGAVISMIGQYRLPLINAAAGVATTLALLAFLVPRYGITGGAISAAIGMNVASIAALGEVFLIHRLQPFDRRFIRPAIVSILLSLTIGWALSWAAEYGLAIKITTGVIALGGSYIFLFYYGFSAPDRHALIPRGPAP